jgi:hypothetical protein
MQADIDVRLAVMHPLFFTQSRRTSAEVVGQAPAAATVLTCDSCHGRRLHDADARLVQSWRTRAHLLPRHGRLPLVVPPVRHRHQREHARPG